MTDINIIVGEGHGHHGHHPHPHDHDCPHHDPQEVVPFEKEEDDLPPKEAGDDSRTRELIAQEERASNDYEQLADEADDEDTKEVYEDISDEEKVHAGELLVLLLKQDPKQKKALEEGSEEVRELVGGESFRSMFEKGRGKVIDKANGVSIAKARARDQGKDKGKGEKKTPTHTQAVRQGAKERSRSDQRLDQGKGFRENPDLGKKKSQNFNGPFTNPGVYRPYPGGNDTPPRVGPEHDTAGTNDRVEEISPGALPYVNLNDPEDLENVSEARRNYESYLGEGETAVEKYKPPVVEEYSSGVQVDLPPDRDRPVMSPPVRRRSLAGASPKEAYSRIFGGFGSLDKVDEQKNDTADTVGPGGD